MTNKVEIKINVEFSDVDSVKDDLLNNLSRAISDGLFDVSDGNSVVSFDYSASESQEP